jgi:hypothetical protein
MKFWTAILATVLLGSTSLGASEDLSCDRAALAAAANHAVPSQVMLAITRVETGRQSDGRVHPWPWAVNQAGQSHWFKTRAEAEAHVMAALDQGQTNIDIGCFQLNIRWHGAQFSSLQTMFNPADNADYAARFLAENYTKTGNWVDAVARYHSATPAHAKSYIEKIEQVLVQLAQNGAFPPHNDMPNLNNPPLGQNLFPLLQPGTGIGMASLAPVGVGRQPLFATGP